MIEKIKKTICIKEGKEVDQESSLYGALHPILVKH